MSETVSNNIVNSRIGLAKRSIYEIRTVVEDIRADHIGAVQVGLELWQSSVLSSLLYSSEVWSEVPPKSLKQLEETNSLFLANLLGVSKRGCPEVNLYIETSSLLIPNQILLSQLLFLHHIASLPTASLANEVYESMKEKNFPGILRICQPYLTEWNMTDITSYTMWSWKRKIKKMVEEKNWNDLIRWSEKYSKIKPEEVKKKKVSPSTYMKTLNLTESRVLFRRSSSILHTVRMNWKNDKRFREEGYDCIDCLSLEPPVRHPDHQDILVTSVCQGNRDLREGRLMSRERDIAHFFLDLIARRNDKYGC